MSYSALAWYKNYLREQRAGGGRLKKLKISLGICSSSVAVKQRHKKNDGENNWKWPALAIDGIANLSHWLYINKLSFCIVPTEYRGVRREVWTRISGGWYLKHLTSDIRFPNSPTTVEVLQELSSPRNQDDFYGQRLQAYFIAPSSGNYTFYATCDSECVFYLGFDEKPENKKELIRIDQDHRTEYDQWNR